MDRFKFRVWEVKKNKYREASRNNADNCIDYLEGKVLYGEGIEIYGEEDDKDVILEQCTGLKDKNGKLIYEGDILFVKVFDWKTGKIKTYWSVEYKDYANKSGFMVYGKNRRFHKPLTKSAIFNSEAIIIGNIHENKDLLEDIK